MIDIDIDRERPWPDEVWLHWSASCLWHQRTWLDRRPQANDVHQERTSPIPSLPDKKYAKYATAVLYVRPSVCHSRLLRYDTIRYDTIKEFNVD